VDEKHREQKRGGGGGGGGGAFQKAQWEGQTTLGTGRTGRTTTDRSQKSNGELENTNPALQRTKSEKDTTREKKKKFRETDLSINWARSEGRRGKRDRRLSGQEGGTCVNKGQKSGKRKVRCCKDRE